MSANASSEIFPTFSPSKKYSPEVGESSAPRICINVDFPLPEGPMIATNSPLFILKLIFDRATVSTSPVL